MKTKGAWSFKYLSGSIMVGLVLAALACSLDAAPAFAGHDDDRGRKHDRRYEHRGRGHGHDRGHYQRQRVYRTYRYVEPVYVAPPVYYAPPPDPGIRIFFPTIHIR